MKLKVGGCQVCTYVTVSPSEEAAPLCGCVGVWVDVAVCLSWINSFSWERMCGPFEFHRF